LNNETMLAGDPRIINHNVMVLVFQFKSIHGAPHDLMSWCNLIQLQSLCLLLW
jgi:hypothetical protein